MYYMNIGNKVIMTEYESFDIEEILECGQCFRFEKLAYKKYMIIAFGKVLSIKQNIENETVEFYPCEADEFENIWIDYFDLRRNYTHIKEALFESDIILRDAVEFAPGIRILNQDSWETLISFIISQNNRIPQIKQVIKNISQKYGSMIKGHDGCFSFPALEQLSKAGVQDLMDCKCGFRAKYIMDAVEKINSGFIDISRTNAISTDALKETLLQIKGVGTKVADCVLLFGFGRYEYFPTDIWIKRIMQHFYFNGNETSIKDIHSFAFNKFGKNAGFAQQYLFHYARQFPQIFLKN